MTEQGVAVVRPLPGEGVVAHLNGLLLVCGATDQTLEDLLGALRETVAGGGDGRALARRVVRVLARAMDGSMAEPMACAVAGPAGGGVAVLVSGAASAIVSGGPDGQVRLAGREALTWTDRLVNGPVAKVELCLPGAGPAIPYTRLDAGVVSGAGIVLDLTRDGEAGFQPAMPPPVSRPQPYSHAQQVPPPPMPDPLAVREQPAPMAPSPMPPAPMNPGPMNPAPMSPVSSQPMTPMPPPAGPPSEPIPVIRPAMDMPQAQSQGPAPVAAPVPSQSPTLDPLPQPMSPPMSLLNSTAEEELPQRGGGLGLAPEPGASVEEDAGENTQLDRTPEPEPRLMVYGVDCKNDHFNDPRVPYCAVCGVALVQRTLVPYKGPRPPLGALLLDDGMTLRLDSDYVLGRDPERAAEVQAGEARAARVTSPDGSVSRRHLRVALDGWDVNLIDLGSVNGTQIQPPGDPNFYDIPPNESVPILPGTTVRIGVSRTMRYESHRDS